MVTYVTVVLVLIKKSPNFDGLLHLNESQTAQTTAIKLEKMFQ